MEHIEQYHIKFGDKSHNLKQRGHKAFVELRVVVFVVIICMLE